MTGPNVAGVTKNECICASDEEPEQSQLVEDHEAHVLVAEWRLHKFQSPIELKHDDSIHHDHFEPLEFHGHWDKGGKAFLKNTGKTAVLRFESRELPVLVGGPLHEDTYVFEQLHFHWSADDTSGCEHIFEGRAYSMEAHAVHYNTKYADFDEAHDKPDGLAVVGFFLEATDNEDNPCFNKLTNAVKKIVEIGSMTCVPTDCLTWIKEEAQCKGYYTYQGSLTTEPYTESVTWILYPTPIHVSREQVAYFRNMKSNEKTTIVNNVRPLQTPPEHKKLNIIYARSHRKSE
ncbi:carbonic anhydrase 2-like [Cylas formicarius]|uniref:carbonic anhydrase 2-like n=1 Tax=Cylas formicarius TaxID=197179 RepID=UPI0029586D2F|nr:carbonic anhydrase 2-like [Cylas formicarius]